MNNLLIGIKYFFVISFASLFFFFIHKYVVAEYIQDENLPLISIYFFNYFAVLILLSLFKINLNYKLINPLIFFVILTLIKMLSVVGYFIYFDNYFDLNIKALIFNFFPIYFLLLVLEILSLKNSLISH